MDPKPLNRYKVPIVAIRPDTEQATTIPHKTLFHQLSVQVSRILKKTLSATMLATIEMAALQPHIQDDTRNDILRFQDAQHSALLQLPRP